MTIELALPDVVAPGRTATPCTFLMCPPTYFDVVYAINPWMDLGVPVDTARAVAQWEALRATYERHGHTVHVVEPEPGLPDMVYAANGGLVVGGRALAPRFLHPERHAEGPAYARWFDAAARAGVLGADGVSLGQAEELNEGEGDILLVGDLLLAGTGFRTSRAAHAELDRRLRLAEQGITVVSLELVDPRYYHLDTALTVLDAAAGLVAYLPEAFSRESLDTLRDLFPDAILADPDDAAALGLNAVSDGRHVYLNAAATGMHAKLRERGFEPVPVEIDEILKGGGSVKCCTLVLRPSREAP
ncbi:dimethylargininase [Xylanimonas protaetiae]|uniref:N-dimethylarginine dimethylaminohydrolase n=1 Tax=Xylanimonas protaetiae TaxID=2509457 RepID=A0A4P6FFS6_9MICO|nr:dimethylargininase [Xylanimonas protaetiae]QAY69448.1 N-dimethylarginine dimethylaminohydrolase [Xylanimonas protaetiae]